MQFEMHLTMPRTRPRGHDVAYTLQVATDLMWQLQVLARVHVCGAVFGPVFALRNVKAGSSDNKLSVDGLRLLNINESFQNESGGLHPKPLPSVEGVVNRGGDGREVEKGCDLSAVFEAKTSISPAVLDNAFIEYAVDTNEDEVRQVMTRLHKTTTTTADTTTTRRYENAYAAPLWTVTVYALVGACKVTSTASVEETSSIAFTGRCTLEAVLPGSSRIVSV